MGLIQDASTLVKEKDPDFQIEIEHIAHEILSKAEKEGLTSPETANLIMREIKRLSEVNDPYTGFKATEMSQARTLLPRLKKYVGKDLRSRINLAVLGNSFDFFKAPEEALNDIPKQLQEGITFFRDDVVRLERFLAQGPELVLYLTDNSGEIYFDLPLYEYIQERAGRTVLVVKGGPSLNDLTRNEIQAANLEDRFDQVCDTGTDGVGIDWGRVSQEFLDLVQRADLILSKGMANFETIHIRDLSSPVFFLFKVKCRPIQSYLETPPDSFFALWYEGRFTLKSRF